MKEYNQTNHYCYEVIVVYPNNLSEHFLVSRFVDNELNKRHPERVITEVITIDNGCI